MISLKQPLPAPVRPPSGFAVPGSGARVSSAAGRSGSAQPMTTPTTAPAAANLTPFEQREVRDFQARGAVFYTGCDLQRKVFATSDAAPLPAAPGAAAGVLPAPAVYDDADGHYKLIVDDHINYRYQILEVLGKGSFGKVVRARDHKTGADVALKVVKNRSAERHASEKELLFLRSLASHASAPYADRVVALHESFTFRGHLCIVLERLHLNLWAFLEQNQRRLPPSVVRVLVRDALEALVHLHGARIIHCDVKPENLVLTAATPPDSVVHLDQLHAKLVDFGTSRNDIPAQNNVWYIQSRFYRAPEVVLDLPYSTPIDLFSLGCMVPELLTGRPLFAGHCEEEQIYRFMEVMGSPPPEVLNRSHRRGMILDSAGRLKKLDLVALSKKVAGGRPIRPVAAPGAVSLSDVLAPALATSAQDPALLDFIRRLIAWDPTKRMTAQEALAHPWITGATFDGPADAAASAVAAAGVAAGQAASWQQQQQQQTQKQQAGAAPVRPKRPTYMTSAPPAASAASAAGTGGDASAFAAPGSRAIAGAGTGVGARAPLTAAFLASTAAAAAVSPTARAGAGAAFGPASAGTGTGTPLQQALPAVNRRRVSSASIGGTTQSVSTPGGAAARGTPSVTRPPVAPAGAGASPPQQQQLQQGAALLGGRSRFGYNTTGYAAIPSSSAAGAGSSPSAGSAGRAQAVPALGSEFAGFAGANAGAGVSAQGVSAFSTAAGHRTASASAQAFQQQQHAQQQHASSFGGAAAAAAGAQNGGPQSHQTFAALGATGSAPGSAALTRGPFFGPAQGGDALDAALAAAAPSTATGTGAGAVGPGTWGAATAAGRHSLPSGVASHAYLSGTAGPGAAHGHHAYALTGAAALGAGTPTASAYYGSGGIAAAGAHPYAHAQPHAQNLGIGTAPLPAYATATYAVSSTASASSAQQQQQQQFLHSHFGHAPVPGQAPLAGARASHGSGTPAGLFNASGVGSGSSGAWPAAGGAGGRAYVAAGPGSVVGPAYVLSAHGAASVTAASAPGGVVMPGSGLAPAPGHGYAQPGVYAGAYGRAPVAAAPPIRGSGVYQSSGYGRLAL